jgi:hypothetical protein
VFLRADAILRGIRSLISSSALAGDVEGGRVGDGHDGHHAALDRVTYHQVCCVGHGPWHVQGEDYDAFVPDLAHRAGDLPTHEGAGQDQRHGAREAGHGPCCGGELFLADQGDGVYGDLLPTDVVPVGLGDRANNNLPDLRPATDHDDPLPVNLLERGRPLDRPHDGQRLQIADKRVRGLARDVLELEVDRREPVAPLGDVDVGDVRLVVQ